MFDSYKRSPHVSVSLLYVATAIDTLYLQAVIQVLQNARCQARRRNRTTVGDILAHEKDTNRSELIKRLVRDRWLTLQLDKTLVEKRGEHPQHLLQDAPADLSECQNRKAAIATYLKSNS